MSMRLCISMCYSSADSFLVGTRCPGGYFHYALKQTVNLPHTQKLIKRERERDTGESEKGLFFKDKWRIIVVSGTRTLGCCGVAGLDFQGSDLFVWCIPLVLNRIGTWGCL